MVGYLLLVIFWIDGGRAMMPKDVATLWMLLGLAFCIGWRTHHDDARLIRVAHVDGGAHAASAVASHDANGHLHEQCGGAGIA